MTLKNLILLLLVGTSFTALARSADQHFLYQLNTKMLYTDKLINPTSQFVTRDLLSPQKQQSRRALGLTEGRLALNWIHNNKTRLFLVLRPDAGTYNTNGFGEAAEFDSRSGKTFRNPATLKLLDAYSFVIDAGQSFNFEIGVFEAMAPVIMTYDPVLEFGLNVRFTRKYSGLRVLWKVDHEEFPRSQPTVTLGKRLYLLAFQGNDDRTESYEGNQSTFEAAPSSRDPHKGVGFGYNWRPDKQFNLDTFAAYRKNFDANEDRFTELLFRIVWQYNMQLFNKPFQVAQDIRYNRLRYDVPAITAKTLNQTSSSLTSAFWVSDSVAAIAGLHLGQAEHHLESNREKAEIYDGWQLDLGLKRLVNEVLIGHLLMSYESRTLSLEGEELGGFPSSPEPKKNIARFALQLEYKLGGPN